MKQHNLLSIKNVVLMGMFGALSAVLMLFDFPIPFIAPSFYTLDLSEIPVLIGTFSLGPVAGAVIELVKILVKLVLKPTSTGFVGEFANVCIGCSLILPAGLIYQFKKTKKGAIVGMVAGTLIMAVVGAVLNALVMLPFYSNFMPMETILAAGAGASTKVVLPSDQPEVMESRIERCENVKDVSQYIERIDEMIERKEKFFIENGI